MFEAVNDSLEAEKKRERERKTKCDTVMLFSQKNNLVVGTISALSKSKCCRNQTIADRFCPVAPFCRFSVCQAVMAVWLRWTGPCSSFHVPCFVRHSQGGWNKDQRFSH